MSELELLCVMSMVMCDSLVRAQPVLYQTLVVLSAALVSVDEKGPESLLARWRASTWFHWTTLPQMRLDRLVDRGEYR
jgi:hypothetical protein